MDKSLSLQRLSKYKAPHDTDPAAAIERYKWNIKLSQSLYPCLSLVEVALRNHLDMGVTAKFGSDWLTNGSVLLKDQEKQVQDAKDKLVEYGKDVSKANIIASLTFGFWPSLFSEAYRKRKIHADVKIIKAAFPRIPSHFRNPEELSRICTSIRNFRNRVFHHEPIFNIRDLVQKVRDMENLINWMNEKVFDMKAELCNFEEVYWNHGPQADKYFAVVHYQASQRAEILDFLTKEISLIVGKRPDEVRYQSDAILKHALASKYTIRVGIHKNEIIGLLLLGSSSVENLIVTSDWKSSGIYKWMLDFALERYKSGLFVYTFDQENELEALVIEKGGIGQGQAAHPEFRVNRKKFKFP